MIVVSLTDCPLALRGDLSKWLQEINTGVYVGQVSARVREELWKRVKENIKSGRATMVFAANNEQRMDFRVHNTTWEPMDFDGLKLMLRPSSARLRQQSEIRSGFSKATKMRTAKEMSRRHGVLLTPPLLWPTSYLAVDIASTGPSAIEHEICEIEAILVDNGMIVGQYLAAAESGGGPTRVFAVTKRINNSSEEKQLLSLAEVISGFLEFAGDLPVITHREDHVYSFLRAASVVAKQPHFVNRCIDTMDLARRQVEDADSYELEVLIRQLGISCEAYPNEMSKCMATKLLYEKLIIKG